MKKNINNKILLSAIYSHPSHYPPTLNALNSLSELYREIYVLHRNVLGNNWKYPANVNLVSQKKLLNVREAEKAGLLKKIIWFAYFTINFWFLVVKKKPHTILIYDTMPILSYRLIYFFIPKPQILWYHNHDVVELKNKKWSLIWWAHKYNNWFFKKLNYFSLPSLDRKTYFPMDLFKGDFFFLPNYPSKYIYGKESINSKKEINEVLKILYQGYIGDGHGIEEIIQILNTKINNISLQFTIIGPINIEFKQKLLALAKSYKTEDKLYIYDPVAYSDLIGFTQKHHVGIGILKPKNTNFSTAATASNKIYEYIACGLPVLLYDNPYFRNTFINRNWASFTDISSASLLDCMKNIIDNYSYFSQSALFDFYNDLCFDKYIDLIKQKLISDNN